MLRPNNLLLIDQMLEVFFKRLNRIAFNRSAARFTKIRFMKGDNKPIESKENMVARMV
ncbi:MAG: hypothetical protein WKI04_17465 [Ferruginibacter sp.]